MRAKFWGGGITLPIERHRPRLPIPALRSLTPREIGPRSPRLMPRVPAATCTPGRVALRDPATVLRPAALVQTTEVITWPRQRSHARPRRSGTKKLGGRIGTFFDFCDFQLASLVHPKGAADGFRSARNLSRLCRRMTNLRNSL